MNQGKYPHFIKVKAEVAEPDKQRTFGKGEKREDFAAMWSATGTLLLAGLPGSGRNELAQMLSERLGMPFRRAHDAASLQEALSGQASVVVLDDALFDDDEQVAVINGAGKVFYLMADARTLAQRVVERGGKGGMEAVWRETSARLEQVEPRFMQALHFILQANGSPQALLEDALEKVSW